MATAYFMELIIRMTDAVCDQDHLDMIIYNRPNVPDRTKFILGLSDEDPAGSMIETGRKLVEQGVDCIAIPCITAHYFHDQMEAAIGRPILHLIQDTVRHMKAFGVETAGLWLQTERLRADYSRTSCPVMGWRPLCLARRTSGRSCT